jgi:hypothetical protein
MGHVRIIFQAAYDNGLVDDGFFQTCKEDVWVEINRWRNFEPFLIRYLNNFPECRDYDIFDDLRQQRAQQADQ